MSKQEITLSPPDNARLANLCGEFNSHIRQIETRFNVDIHQRGHHFSFIGKAEAVAAAKIVLTDLYAATAEQELNGETVHLHSQTAHVSSPKTHDSKPIRIKTRNGMVEGKGPNQIEYLRQISTHDINFGIGPAGTGKTYLAVACAVQALEKEEVKRIILVRPAVEAGEKLGFLPGDLSQKVDPYLRPLYDALFEMMGVEKVGRLIERNIIEIAPLAYMRGRTLNEAFIILDEAQNTTAEQMKMFLTRIGFGSTAVVTGDVTQIDLPRHQCSGLKHILDILQDIEGISFNFMTSADVVRHPLVGRIIDAYDAFEKDHENR